MKTFILLPQILPQVYLRLCKSHYLLITSQSVPQNRLRMRLLIAEQNVVSGFLKSVSTVMAESVITTLHLHFMRHPRLANGQPMITPLVNVLQMLRLPLNRTILAI